jgi:hypothetical protein
MQSTPPLSYRVEHDDRIQAHFPSLSKDEALLTISFCRELHPRRVAFCDFLSKAPTIERALDQRA